MTVRNNEEPTLTSIQIVEIQQELVYLMGRAAEERDPDELAAIDKRVEALYEFLGEAAEDKLVALRAVVRRLESERDMLKRESEVIGRARKSHDRGIERAKCWATGLLQGLASTHGKTKLSHGGRTFWLAKNWQLQAPEAVELWPEQWRKTNVLPSRGAAREALAAGADVPDGFAWKQVEGIRWR